jgi:hypothetical protein
MLHFALRQSLAARGGAFRCANISIGKRHDFTIDFVNPR